MKYSGTDPLLGEICIFAFNFPPRGYALCDGSLLAIRSNTALFSILGVTYGGDGRTTFGLPNLKGRTLLHCGNSQGNGLSAYSLGEVGGQGSVTLTSIELPAHAHMLQATVLTASAKTTANAINAFPAPATSGTLLYSNSANGSRMAQGEVNVTMQPNGGNQPHNNFQPTLVLNISIALVGVFPQRH